MPFESQSIGEPKHRMYTLKFHVNESILFDAVSARVPSDCEQPEKDNSCTEVAEDASAVAKLASFLIDSR
jgi:hypothetical protein